VNLFVKLVVFLIYGAFYQSILTIKKLLGNFLTLKYLTKSSKIEENNG